MMDGATITQGPAAPGAPPGRLAGRQEESVNTERRA
jgi:hypothetical protein